MFIKVLSCPHFSFYFYGVCILFSIRTSQTLLSVTLFFYVILDLCCSVGVDLIPKFSHFPFSQCCSSQTLLSVTLFLHCASSLAADVDLFPKLSLFPSPFAIYVRCILFQIRIPLIASPYQLVSAVYFGLEAGNGDILWRSYSRDVLSVPIHHHIPSPLTWVVCPRINSTNGDVKAILSEGRGAERRR